MTVSYSTDHVGRLVVQCSDQIEVEIQGVTLGQTRSALVELSRHESAMIKSDSGRLYLIDGLRFIAGYWDPNRGGSS